MGIEADYYNQYTGITPEEYVRKTQLENPKQVERALTIARYIPHDATSVLDVGCGGGLALNAIGEQRPDLHRVGLERSEKTAQAARNLFGLEVIDGSADALPFEDKSFDVVMANEILEHLPWGVYEDTLRELARVAKKTILITTPYQEKRQFVTCPKCACSFSPFYHIRSFSDSSLGRLFDGFERVEQELMWVKGRAPFLYEARRLKAALGRVPPLPRHTICPQCGYRNQPKSTGGETGDGLTASSPSLLNRVMIGAWGLIPRPKRAKWAIVRYAARP